MEKARALLTLKHHESLNIETIRIDFFVVNDRKWKYGGKSTVDIEASGEPEQNCQLLTSNIFLFIIANGRKWKCGKDKSLKIPWKPWKPTRNHKKTLEYRWQIKIINQKSREPNLSKIFDNEGGLSITGYHASLYRRKNAKDGKKYNLFWGH